MPTTDQIHDPTVRLTVQILVLLVTAHLLGALAARTRLPAVVGHLTAGLLVGPALLHLLPATAIGTGTPLNGVVQFGAVLLVGVTGLHVPPQTLWRLGRAGATVAATGLALPGALGALAGLLAPAALAPADADRTLFAGMLAVALGVSAIPVAAAVLAELGLLHRPLGQLTLVAGVLDDAVGWFGLSVLVALAGAGGAADAVPLAARAVVLLAAFVLAARLSHRPLARLARHLLTHGPATGPAPTDPDAHGHGPGPGLTALAVVVVLTGAATTAAMGFEPLFGAFVAGLVLAGALGPATAHLNPLHTLVLGVFSPLFLASAGLHVPAGALTDPLVLGATAVLLALAVLGKVVGAWAGALAAGLDHRTGLALGAGLSARGVIQVTVAATGLAAGLLTERAYTVVVLVALATSLLAGPLLRLVCRTGPAPLAAPPPTTTPAPPVAPTPENAR